MAGNRTLKLSILADVDDLKKKLGQGEQEVKGFGDKLGEFGKKAAAAFAIAAAAAAAYAGKLLVDGVKAAIEDEKAQVKLAKTLENTTGATKDQIKAVEDQILQMSLATGVADDKLRPSFEKLVRATNDVEKAQKLQTLALDIAAGSGKDLDAVSQSLARAYDGNTSALSRLGIGLSAAELKSMSFDDVTAQLADTFGGQASIQADTFSGKVARLQVAFDEAKESVGARLLPILTNLLDKFNNNLAPAVESIRKKFEPLTKALDENKEEFTAIWNFLNKYIVPILTGALKTAVSGIVTTFTTLVNIIGKAVNFFGDLYNAYKKFVDFIKNNPLSKFIGKINPFDNASFTTQDFDSFNAPSASFVTANLVSPITSKGMTLSLPPSLKRGGRYSFKFLREQGYSDEDILAWKNAGLIVTTTPEGLTMQELGLSNLDPQEQVNEFLRRRAAGELPQAQAQYNITVNGALDSESTARQIIELLNESAARGTQGALALTGVTV